MKLAATIFLAGSTLALAAPKNADHVELIYEISRICGDRWEVTLPDGEAIAIRAVDKASGHRTGGGNRAVFPGTPYRKYNLYVHFTVVADRSANEVDEAKRELQTARLRAKRLGLEIIRSNRLDYVAKTGAEWALVLQIKKLEQFIRQIPDYNYKSVHLAETHSDKNFDADQNDPKSVKLMSDVATIYKLLTPNKAP